MEQLNHIETEMISIQNKFNKMKFQKMLKVNQDTYKKHKQMIFFTDNKSNQ